MKKWFFLLLIIISVTVLFLYINTSTKPTINPRNTPTPSEKPLLAYTFENLRKTTFPISNIKLNRPFSETPDSTAQIFYFETPVKPNSTDNNTVSGLMNIPKKSGKYPIIVLLRGFVPEEIYEPGVGTQHVAEAFAQHGFITLAPDFLGFGESSPTSADSFEARFQTYTTALTLLSSLSTLNDGLQASNSGISSDSTKIGIWGHSNGGHIALSILELSGLPYPTVLWAPVSKSFPYSILFYSDDSKDHGKALRLVLAHFERDYDVDLFSPINYYSWIKAPISIYQGDIDDAVPLQWSQDLASILKENNVSAAYHVFNGDHNMVPSWSEAVKSSISFFDSKFSTNDLVQ